MVCGCHLVGKNYVNKTVTGK